MDRRLERPLCGREEKTLPLDERQRRLISLLIAGHTDASAAHRLGVSPRTVTNILRSLMDALGVDNRFQLGIALGRRMRTPAAPRPGAQHGVPGQRGLPAGQRAVPVAPGRRPRS
ncbi:putative transcriptional regulator [Streptomyces albus]|uniref:Putative transcriptional regulator n=1 Tax=Streptomyces albus (strain ATCC 21838 / DSM 41398 / FERM P-419 / JCM 4703 / NBRC 107858) TaxID=1081613 RepID=A0A0B5F2K2_STRA4|nr:putative transcriptional regulator [Streptomyces albus]AOU80104.1 putative transcriptional regulator [Streptomyces albus]AYN35821.1 LuxR family transcriptional regulator [Streptomyces albus]